MTEKRFTYDSKTVSILKDGEFWLDGQVDTACNHSEICKELNHLHEENKELKERRHEDINELAVIAIKYKAMQDENEQLKKEILWWKYRCGEDISGGERMTEKQCDDCKYYRKSDDYCYYRGYGSKRDCKSFERKWGIYD